MGKISAVTTNSHSNMLVVGQGTVMQLPDSTFYRMARKISFPVNQYRIPDTSTFVRELREEIVPEARRQGLTLTSVMMRGAASPEGTLRYNTLLAQRRLQAVLDLVRADLPQVDNDSIGTHGSIAEDYPYLVKLMRETDDPDLALVDSLVTLYINKDVALLKQKLQTLRGGRLWKRMLRQYFPQLRTTHIVLVFRRPDSEELVILEKPTPKTATALPFPSADGLPKEVATVAPLAIPMPPPLIAPTATPLTKRPRREFMSLKTNLLLDFAYVPGYDRFCPIPNVAVEFYPLHGHFTYGASFDCPWWQGDISNHKYFQVRNYQVESRYYFRSGDVDERGYGQGAAFQGWYAQAYAHLALFGLGFSEKRGWQGEGGGAGLGGGYVLPLSKDGHWRLDFGLQVGYFRCKYDPYQFLCPVDPTEHDQLYYYKWTGEADLFRKRQYRWTWFGPTRIGITLSYDLLYRKRDKKGASFRKWEKTKEKK